MTPESFIHPECPYHDLTESRLKQCEDKQISSSEINAVLQSKFAAYSISNIKELEKINTCLTEIKKDINDLKIKFAVGAVKQGGWGVLGGMIPALTALFIWWVKTNV